MARWICVFALALALGQVAEADFPRVFGRVSFFVNAGIRLVEEIAKLHAMGRLWNEAMGLPRPWDQQWSLRIQQVLAHETGERSEVLRGRAKARAAT